jgi:citrate lyase subunit beta/citryl-CoA lyase
MNAIIKTARSFLFVPADRPERLSKALATPADAVIVDFEDAVAVSQKEKARELLADALNGIEDTSRLLVRINPCASSWHEEDLAFVAGRRFGGIVLPKAEDVADIEQIASAASIPVIALIESARGLDMVAAISRARGVARLAFGHLDFQLDTGIECSADERELDSVRLAISLASRCAALPAPIDGVTTAMDDEAKLTADALRSRRFGFRGKLCIHPRQVAAVNRAFSPDDAQVAWALSVVEAARESNGAAFALHGQMVDAPVIQRAQALLEIDR